MLHHLIIIISNLASLFPRLRGLDGSPQSDVSTPLCPVPTPFSYPVIVGPSSHIQTMSSCSYLYSWHLQPLTLYNVTPRHNLTTNLLFQDVCCVSNYWCHQRRDLWVHNWFRHDVGRFQLETQLQMVPRSTARGRPTCGRPQSATQVQLTKL